MAVYKVGASGGELKKNRFEFEIGGETLSVPKMEFLSEAGDDWVKKSMETGMSQREYVLGLIAAVNPEAGEKVAAAGLARDQIRDLYQAWIAASKVDEGKS